MSGGNSGTGQCADPGGSEVELKELVLLVDGNSTRANSLCHLLRESGTWEPVRVPAVAAAIREASSRRFALIVTDTTVQREGDGLKLVRLVLEEAAVTKAPPVLVLTADTDPTVVQQCLRAGVADYVLYPCDGQALLQRVSRAAGHQQSLSERVVRVATPYLGPAARVFLQQLVRAHLPGVAYDSLAPEHLPELFRWMHAIGTKVVGRRAEELIRQLEVTFRVRRSQAAS